MLGQPIIRPRVQPRVEGKKCDDAWHVIGKKVISGGGKIDLNFI